MQKNPLDESIDSMRKFQETMKEATTQTDDVKNGDCTAEDEQQEPGYILYNAIAESSISIMQLPTVVKAFTHLSEKLGEETSKELVEMLVLVMTHSAHNAIVFYDELLKKELDNQFDHYGEVLNKFVGTVNGHEGALQVFKKKLGDLETAWKLEQVNKNTGKH